MQVSIIVIGKHPIGLAQLQIKGAMKDFTTFKGMALDVSIRGNEVAKRPSWSSR